MASVLRDEKWLAVADHEEHHVHHVLSALGRPSVSSSRASLRLVTRALSPKRPATPRGEAPEPDELPGREREKRLVDASRDAHFAVRRRFRELAPEVAGSGLEFLYDQARRIDSELTGLYQARAAVLAHRLQRATAASSRASASVPDGAPVEPTVGDPRSVSDLSLEERALVMRLRAAPEHERRTLLHLAVRFAEARRAES